MLVLGCDLAVGQTQRVPTRVGAVDVRSEVMTAQRKVANNIRSGGRAILCSTPSVL
jgi:hypothetical protein